MKRFLLILLCLLMVVGMTACGNETEDKEKTDTTEEQGTVVYALDDVINRFFVEFIETYNGDYLDTRSIRRAPGTDSTKSEDLTKEYLATINGCNVTLRNATYTKENDKGEMLTLYQLRVVIEGGTTIQSRDQMMTVFRTIAPIADPDCSAVTADRAVEQMEAMTANGSLTVSTFLKVESYTPIIEEYGVPTKIELVAYNFEPLDQE